MDRDCIADGKPLYHDDGHLSAAGAEFVSSIFEPVFKPAQP
ncbi:MAG: hypothetical protein K9G60_00045 [Pseudolabrys sp.]|nr:hypothetical protein [Pseudolabrys sp.]